ncbi:Serine protease OS=Streptomyces alboniger OX=132473 GN=CP975_12860 PE=4 SV=1 [Streptomyces alboniger]
MAGVKSALSSGIFSAARRSPGFSANFSGYHGVFRAKAGLAPGPDGGWPVVYDEYFIQIFREGRRLGFGLRLTRDFALAPAHCMKRRELDGMASVRLCLPDGKRATGEVQDFDRSCDLALLRLVFQKDEDVQLPAVCFDTARQHEVWRATHQLPDSSEILGGRVADVSHVYGRTRRGMTVTVLRLACSWFPDDHTVFAGSPVERGAPYDWPVVLGLIVEHRAQNGAAADELLAGTVQEAVTQFSRFRFRMDDFTADPAPPLAVGPFVVNATETENKIRIEAAVENALGRAGYGRVLGIPWTDS